mmetsp:Transcript_76371/g.134867  ORF Transcript_76371/g.134867 Transcript_76371/m.134867 type:complete len:83 (-) Transcript_76371:779-1027(-)
MSTSLQGTALLDPEGFFGIDCSSLVSPWPLSSLSLLLTLSDLRPVNFCITHCLSADLHSTLDRMPLLGMQHQYPQLTGQSCH